MGIGHQKAMRHRPRGETQVSKASVETARQWNCCNASVTNSNTKARNAFQMGKNQSVEAVDAVEAALIGVIIIKLFATVRPLRDPSKLRQSVGR